MNQIIPVTVLTIFFLPKKLMETAKCEKLPLNNAKWRGIDIVHGNLT